VPLHKCKLNAKYEYEFVTNFKVLQAAFDRHKIDNAIPVDRLMKCKFQDNIEFLQMLKKYWDQHFPGGGYDALARRSSTTAAGASVAPAPQSAGKPSVEKPTRPKAAASSSGGAARSGASGPASVGRAAGARAAAAAGGMAGADEAAVAAAAEETRALRQECETLRARVDEVREAGDSIERERDFYFRKLREIETVVQEVMDGQVSDETENVMRRMQAIMYQAEDGFEVPEEAIVEGSPDDL
ncbi:hypothetical protein HK405_013383, partial [Cladochytrium tenue]